MTTTKLQAMLDLLDEIDNAVLSCMVSDVFDDVPAERQEFLAAYTSCSGTLREMITVNCSAIEKTPAQTH